MSPNGSHAFLSLRGPNPLTADPHVSTGNTPGVGVLKVTEGGRNAVFESVVQVSNIDAEVHANVEASAYASGNVAADMYANVAAEATGRAMQTLLGKTLHLVGGAATALHWAINSVKKGGIVSIVGVYGPIDCLVPIGNVVNKGLTLRANQASVKRLLPRLIEQQYPTAEIDVVEIDPAVTRVAYRFFGVAHEAVDGHLPERDVVLEVEAHLHHPGDPEEDDVETGVQHGVGVEAGEVVGLLRGDAHAGEGRRVDPHGDRRSASGLRRS